MKGEREEKEGECDVLMEKAMIVVIKGDDKLRLI